MCLVIVGQVHCNDVQMRRVNDMRNMLLQYVPDQGGHRDKVTLKRQDATNAEIWSVSEQDKYDKILVNLASIAT